MVRSLATKLTAAFLLVGLTGALLVAVIVRQQTQAAFGRFILDREQQSLVDYLQRYYRAFGNWDNPGEDLQLGSPPIFRSDEGRRDFRRPWEWFTLVDPEGIVVLGGPHFVPGQILSGWDTNWPRPRSRTTFFVQAVSRTREVSEALRLLGANDAAQHP